MSRDELNPGQRKLSVVELTNQAYRLVFTNPGDMARILTVFAGVWLLTDYATVEVRTDVIDNFSGEGDLEGLFEALTNYFFDFRILISLLVFSLVTSSTLVSLQRYALLGERPAVLAGLKLGEREARYLGYMILKWLVAPLAAVLVTTILALSFYGPVVFSIVQNDIPDAVAVKHMLLSMAEGMVIVMLTIIVVTSTIVTVRLELMFSAIVLGRCEGPLAQMQAAWALSKGHVWKMLAIFILSLLPLPMLERIMNFGVETFLSEEQAATTAITFTVETLSFFINLFGSVLPVAAFSLVYKQLNDVGHTEEKA